MSGGAREHERSLQETYAPRNECFGCGPANAKGLRIRSFPVEGSTDSTCVCTWRAEPHHIAFPGMLNGGICGALLDCHSNWTAAYHLMKARGLSTPPCTVTAEFDVTLKRPTPIDGPLELVAHVVSTDGDKVTVDAELLAHVPSKSGSGLEKKVTATCHGIFVAVKEGHPAYHRW